MKKKSNKETEEKVKLFDFLNDISHGKSKDGILTEENEKQYVPFVINRFLAASVDTVLFANEMNIVPWLPKRMQYDYLRLSIRSKRRFLEWLRPEKVEAIENIQEYYGYSAAKAREVLPLHSEDDLAYIKQRLSKGGTD